MLLRVALAACLLASACKKSDEPAPGPEAETSPTEIHWIEDDYPAALAQARREKKPLVIDMWASWCHTCLSMKHYVLTDPGLSPLADRFVWLALDTEKASTAPVLEKLPISFWPTFFVLHPEDESVQARHIGAASVEQFRTFLLEGERGHLIELEKEGALAEDDPLTWVRAGDRASLENDWDRAAATYTKALATAKKNWRRRPDVLLALVTALRAGEKWGECVGLALTEMDHTGNAASAADFLSLATSCAGKLPEDDTRRTELLGRAEARLDEIVHDAAAPLSVDDRSDAMRILREIRVALGDAEGARAIAEEQRALLDRAAAEAHSPLAASTFNWPRAEVYVYLGKAGQLIPHLKKSEADLPKEYDPPYRLAWIHHELGDYENALAAAERALERVYGPRTARVLDLLASIHKARGDREGELAARQRLVELYASLPESQKKPEAEAAAQAALSALERQRGQ